MRFVLLAAFRETRAGWRRLVFFFLCIALGVGAIVALRSVIQSVRTVLSSEARTLIAADILLSSDRPWEADVDARIAMELRGIAGAERSDSLEMATMARPAAGASTLTKIVELRAVQAAFPFYGTLTLQDGSAYSHRLLQGRGALVRPELLAQLGVRVGDEIAIGRSRFTIRGVIANEPGRSPSAFSLGPRVLIDHADLPETGLLGYGARVVRQVLLRVPDAAVDSVAEHLTEDLRTRFVRVRSYRDRREQIGEDLGRAENYLSLVGLVIVVLGGIAVSSVTRVFVRQKIKSIAVMKCLGATSRQILSVYLLQSLGLGLLGSLIGVGLAAIALVAIPEDLNQIGTLSVAYGLTASAVAQGISIGVLISLLFAAVPLLEVRQVKPALLLRHEAAAKRRDWAQMLAAAVAGVALLGLASWQAASLRIALDVCLGFAGVAVVLHLAGVLLMRLTRPLAQSPWFPLRQAVLHMGRPGNQTRVILLTVGLGAFFIMGVRGIQSSLLEQFAMQIGDQAPDLFLVDIQQDQAPALQQLLSARLKETQPRLIPVLRARVTGRGVRLEEVEDLQGRGMLSREYVITYRDHLEPNETLLAGRFPDGSASASGESLPEVSVEESVRERFGISLGDVVRFDVLGRVVEARVTSIREVNWRDGRSGGFMFVFGPGVFEQAPHYYIAPIRMPSTDASERAQLEHDIVSRFPNISIIDLREVLETVRKVFGVVSTAIAGVGTLVVLTGGFILAGAVAVTKFQRVYEAAIFKTLGASSRAIGAMLLVEYGLVGALAGCVGSFGALVLGWGISRYTLDIPWRPSLGENLAGTIATAALVAVIGVAASVDVLRRKPLATLRAE